MQLLISKITGKLSEQAERSEALTATEGAISWGVWGDAVSPPNGVQGQRPKKFEILVPLDGRKLLFQHAFNE